MVRNLKKIGDELMLVIDPETAERMSLNETTPLNVKVEGRQLTITVVQTASDEAVREALEDTNQRYGGMLKRLAE